MRKFNNFTLSPDLIIFQCQEESGRLEKMTGTVNSEDKQIRSVLDQPVSTRNCVLVTNKLAKGDTVFIAIGTGTDVTQRDSLDKYGQVGISIVLSCLSLISRGVFGDHKRAILILAVYPRLVTFLHLDTQSTSQKSNCLHQHR